MNIDLMAFPGHKCLYGPQGTGGLYVRPSVVLDPLKQGGTGSHSDQLHQPEDVPFRYESGTLNVPGIAGLEAGIRFLMDTGMDQVQEKETRLMHLLIEELQKIPDVTLFGPKHGDRGPVLSITLEGYEPQDVAIILDEMFDIGVRSGLHCAPDAHQAAGTLESGGTIRISPGYFTTEEEILACARALQTLTEE